jgi:cardiolipin synthase (CMP-forming)
MYLRDSGKDVTMKLNWANRITILRILLLIPFVSCMLNANDPEATLQMRHMMRYISIVIFLTMAVSDIIDGYLARRKSQVTAIGSFLDPMADKLLMTCACVLLTLPRGGIEGFLLPTTVAVLIVGKDMFLLMGFFVIYLTTFQVKVVPALIGKIATALQLSMVTAILLAPDISHVITGWIWFLRVLWWSAAGTAVLATLIYIRMGSRYIEQYEQSINHKNN